MVENNQNLYSLSLEDRSLSNQGVGRVVLSMRDLGGVLSLLLVASNGGQGSLTCGSITPNVSLATLPSPLLPASNFLLLLMRKDARDGIWGPRGQCK